MRGVVVGHDHRHNSQRWAELTATAFIAKGVKVYLHQGLVHTPMLVYPRLVGLRYSNIDSTVLHRVPFSVKTLHAACGVMITGPWSPRLHLPYK